MSTNKHALVRYLALDRCLRNFHRRYYIEDLVEACQDAIWEMTGEQEGVQKRQVFKDLDYMQDSMLFKAKIEKIQDGHRKYYRYADRRFSLMGSQFDDDDLNMMKESLLMLRRLKGLPNYEWVEDFLLHIENTCNVRTTSETVVEFGSNPFLVGIERLEELMDAAINHQALKIVYEPFGKPKKNWIIHPYYLKQYNNRWFLFGLNEKFKDISNLAIDRIRSVEKADVNFIPNMTVNFQDGYFADIIGVTLPNDEKDRIVQEVQLQFNENRFPFVENKPLHRTQKTIDRENHIIQIKVIPNKELVAQILSFGNEVTVIKPDELRKEIRDIAIKMMENNK